MNRSKLFLFYLLLSSIGGTIMLLSFFLSVVGDSNYSTIEVLVLFNVIAGNVYLAFTLFLKMVTVILGLTEENVNELK